MLRALTMVLGVLWGATYFVMNAIGWGEPGTDAYRAYELFNRLLAFVLLALAAVTFALRKTVSAPLPRRALVAMSVALLVMATGSALEFWIFSVTPYAPGSLRGLGWGTYCLGLLAFYLAGAVLGVWLLRSRSAPLAGVAFLAWLPMAGLLFGAGRLFALDLPALAPAVAVSGLAYVLFALRR